MRNKIYLLVDYGDDCNSVLRAYHNKEYAERVAKRIQRTWAVWQCIRHERRLREMYAACVSPTLTEKQRQKHQVWIEKEIKKDYSLKLLKAAVKNENYTSDYFVEEMIMSNN